MIERLRGRPHSGAEHWVRGDCCHVDDYSWLASAGSIGSETNRMNR